MNDTSNLIHRDLNHLWHPCSQMKDYETFKPLIVKEASGSYLTLSDGRKIIDAISSWWCKSLGHAHPRLKKALLQQIEKFEHVILANTTNEVIVNLSEKLSRLTSSLNKIFYAGDGSCAVEIALKMSLHARQIQGEKNRSQFIALENAYHGETVGALSVSDLGIYRDPYKKILFDTKFISSVPYVNSVEDKLWEDSSEHWEQIEKQLQPYADTATALIIEPIVQGAGGMQIYSQDFLKRLRNWTKKNNIHLIADEIMTGLGRTGKMLACEYAGILPDFLCLGKGLTAGWMPFSAVLIPENMYQLFYDDYAAGKSFLHSHTFSGNVMGAAIALEVLNIIQEKDFLTEVNRTGKIMMNAMMDIAESTGKLKNVRGIGAIVAADLIVQNPKQRAGFAVYQKATELGALLRPLGNTIYWLPPLNVSAETLEELKEITEQAVTSVSF